MKRIKLASFVRASRLRHCFGSAGSGAKHLAADGDTRQRRRRPQPTASARSSSPARASAATRSTRMRRSCSSTRPRSRRPACRRSPTCCSGSRAPSGGLNTKVNASGNLGNPPDGGGVGAGSADDRSALPRHQPHPGAGRRPALRQRHERERHSRARSTSTPFPTNMIDRIEVLQAGASPLYGSDAIAGVVNIITVQQQEGLRASAQYGSSGRATARPRIIRRAMASSPRRRASSFGGNYAKQKPVFSRDRIISQFPNPFQTDCCNGGGGCSSARGQRPFH